MAELYVLGGLDLREGGERLDEILAQPKRTALLAYLVVATPPGFQSRDTLLALLWPESGRRRARASLRKALHFLRGHLGQDAVVSRGDTVAAGVWSDAAAFDAACEEGEPRKALELYRGDLLDGFHLSGAPAFERWLEGERQRLRRRALTAAWRVAELEEEAGNGIEAARFAHRALRIDPLDGISVRRLMELLHRLGDRAGALRVYERQVVRLRDELGTEPAAETRELKARILRSGEEVTPRSVAESRERSDGHEERGDRRSDSTARGLESSTLGAKELSAWTSRSRDVLVGAVVLLVVLGAALSVREGVSVSAGPGDSSSHATVAVLPFVVGGDENALWQDGMVTLLSTSFQGAAGLTVREPDHVLKLWDAEFDGATPTWSSAMKAGRRLGATWVVTGTLTGRGDEVRLTAKAGRIADGEDVGPVVVDGPRNGLFALVDRLTLELLRQGMVAVDPKALPADISRVTTGSLAAFQAYLEGERAWRAGRLSEAADAFSRAVHEDSTFALAHYRLAIVYFWADPEDAANPYLSRAARHADRLHDREASLIRGTFAVRMGSAEAAIDTFRSLTARHPEFVDGWIRYGDALFHRGPKLLLAPDGFRQALLRAVEVNPLAVEPYWHLIEDAFFREDSATALRLLEAYKRVDQNLPACIGYETAFDLTWGDSATRRAAGARLSRLGGGNRESLHCALSLLELAPRHRVALETVARELESNDRPDSERRRAIPFRNRANVRAGRIAAVRSALLEGDGPENDQLAAQRILLLDLTTYHDPRSAAEATRILRETPTPVGRFWLGASALRHGRVEEALRLAARLRSQSAHPESVDLARALELLASMRDGGGDPELLNEVQRAVTLDERIHPWLRIRIGEMLLERGEPDRALRYLESLTMHIHPLLAPSFLLRARAYEAMADTTAAADMYRRFLDWWSDADPELEAHKQLARAGLERLSG